MNEEKNMKYVIYKLYFVNGVHLGRNSLENSEYAFCADTLFSALCQEAMKKSEDTLERFLAYVKKGQLVFSDAFPFMGNDYYLPKPFMYIDHGEQTGDSTVKKAYKKMKYVPCSSFEEYLKGMLSKEKAESLKDFGHSYRKVSASIRGEEETKPYRVGVYYYEDGNGLYFIAGMENDEIQEILEELLEGLSYVGIGGKRSSGLGKFNCFPESLPDLLKERLEGSWNRYMTLSLSLPKEEELQDAIKDADYSVMKRSGFVASETYADEQMRKRDLYVFSAGSCFTKKYSGDVYDVSGNGRHPVYRYAMPMFMGVDV